ELAALFMSQFSASLGMPSLDLNEETLLKLRRYDWPGNVRELKNLIERSVILGNFPDEFSGDGKLCGSEAMENLDLVIKRHIVHILDLCDGNRAEAARRLGVSRKTIDRKLMAWAD
ncbi:MAG: helix-turn-helix domain-containing protein, partial [Mangrovicoccus sp.]